MLFFSAHHFFWTDCQKPFSQRFILSYQESVWPKSNLFIGHTKKSFRKNCSQVVIHDTCDTWHGLCTVTRFITSQKVHETVRNLETSESEQLVREWQKIQWSKQREIELISKKVWRKRKDKMFRLRRWLLLQWNNTKTVVEEHLSSENVCTYLYSAGRWSDDEVAMYLLTYHQLKN